MDNIVNLLKEDNILEALNQLEKLKTNETNYDIFLDLKNTIANLDIPYCEQKKIMLSKLTLLYGLKEYIKDGFNFTEDNISEINIKIIGKKLIGIMKYTNQLGEPLIIYSTIEVILLEKNRIRYQNLILTLNPIVIDNLDENTFNLDDIEILNTISLEYEF